MSPAIQCKNLILHKNGKRQLFCHGNVICGLHLAFASARQECHCMLFLTEDNDFAGKDQSISMEEVKSAIVT